MHTVIKMKKTFKEKLIQLFIVLLPAIIAFGTNCIAYIGSPLFIREDRLIFLDMEIDRMIPFIPQFVIIYGASFLQWLNYFLQGCFGPEKLRNKYFSADTVAKIFCFFFFILCPIAMRWPQLDPNGGLWIKLVSFAYGVDSPARAFPSLHCFYSWMAARYSFEREPKERKWISWLQLAYSISLFASTVLIKQHYFVDIIGGVGLAELSLQLAAHTKLPELFGKLVKKITDKIPH